MQKSTPALSQLIRLFQLLLHVTFGLLQSVIYPYFSLSVRRKMMRKWAYGLLSILGIDLKCHGNLPPDDTSPILLVANHVSWLDICILMAACPTRFVSKAEISRWPVLGMLSQNVGTLFIERTKRSDTLRINQQIGAALRKGERVTIFPEGTTTNGMQLNHFHASLLQSAISINATVLPVAIRYKNRAGEICLEAAYIDPSLVASLRKILNQPRINAELTFAPPILANMRNRRELARAAEHAIAETLSVPIVHKES